MKKRYFVDCMIGGQIIGVATHNPNTLKPFTASSAHAFARKSKEKQERTSGPYEFSVRRERD